MLRLRRKAMPQQPIKGALSNTMVLKEPVVEEHFITETTTTTSRNIWYDETRAPTSSVQGRSMLGFVKEKNMYFSFEDSYHALSCYVYLYNSTT
ncbi:hypothetical protein PVK06_032103 [Gossypium arboreum]|uniref:Uncharacterized protein n=1 Tax=Gossypium arboreum TaxID=29729 RepID=A0ABR0NTJ4_GOSAR|nr:hypothetical protein PVK06_032103 [Gossypium arboreum]